MTSEAEDNRSRGGAQGQGPDADVILVGCGLANGLIAHRLATARPDVRILVLEAQDDICGDHVWSFHETDVTPAQDRWLGALARAQWPKQVVRFPSYERTLDIGYRSVVSAGLREAIRAEPSITVRVGTQVRSASPTQVVLEDGAVLTAPCVIDGRGAGTADGLIVGYQNFYGAEIATSSPHGLTTPVIMDATVTQYDGYRFVYVLPFAPDRVLIEDTYYADAPGVDRDVLRGRVDAYVAGLGLHVDRVVRDERGVLPIVLDGPLTAIWPEGDGPPRVGMHAGLFHQTTGYSLPMAAMVADHIAAMETLESAALSTWLRRTANEVWDFQGYYRMLNRLLFVAAAPEQRRAIFERFYRLPQPLVGRFYASAMTYGDRLRVLAGKPPIPIISALGALPPAAARRAGATKA